MVSIVVPLDWSTYESHRVDLHFGVLPAGVPLLHDISFNLPSLGHMVRSKQRLG